MAQVLIRNVDDHVIQSLKLKAEIEGRSLEQMLRDILTKAAPLTPLERVALSDRIAAMQSKPASVPSEMLVRKDRDRDGP